MLSLLAIVAAKDISVIYSPSGDYACYEKCGGPVESCPKVICPTEWEENEKVEAEAIEGQFPGMMGMPGMGMMGDMGGMGMMGMPGMGMMGGMGGMGMMGGMGGMGGCGCQPICRPCMPW